MNSYQYCINPYLCTMNSYRVCYHHHVVFGAYLFFLQSNQPDFFFRHSQLQILKDGGVAKRNLSVNIELETLEVKIYANLRQFLPFFQQTFKLNNFSLRGQLLRPPYLVPTMSGGLHAKFQDSWVYNKKGMPPFHCLGQILHAFKKVCILTYATHKLFH